MTSGISPRLFSDSPTGESWDIATSERNWLVWQYQQRGAKGTRKQPVLNGRNVGAPKAACRTLEEALSEAKSRNAQEGWVFGEPGCYGVGYLAREGSALITVDLDNCLDAGKPIGRAGEVAKDTETYAEASVSGKGLRLIMPREGGASVFVSDTDLGDGTKAGIYASDSRFAAISGICFNGIRSLHHNLAPLQAAIKQAANLVSSEKPAANKKTNAHADETWKKHWLSKLPAARQREAVQAMLSCLKGTKFHNQRDEWMKVLFACRDLEARLPQDRYWNVEALFDEWSQTGKNYNPAENDYQWDSVDRQECRISWGTLVHLAREGGFDAGPWSEEASQQEALETQEQSKRLATKLQSMKKSNSAEVSSAECVDGLDLPDTVDLANPPGLVGAIMDHSQRISERNVRLTGLSGALAAIAGASKGRFVLKSPRWDTPVGILVLLIAPSGFGKEEAIAVVDEGRQAGAFNVAGPPASDAALHQMFDEDPSWVIVIDEFGRFMQSIDQQQSHQFRMLSLLMEIYAAFLRSLKARHYARSQDKKKEVHHPALTGLFATTNESLMKGLTGEAATDGFLGRMLPLAACNVPPLSDGNVDKARWPKDVRSAFAKLKDWQMPSAPIMADHGGIDSRFLFGASVSGRQFLRIQMTSDADKYFFRARVVFDQMRQTASPNLAPIWNRALEAALRVAGVVALGNAAWTDTLDEPICDLAILRWACVLVHQAICSIAPDVNERAVDGVFDGLRKSLVNAINRHADDEGWANKTKVLSTCRCADRPNKQVKEELDGLCGNGFDWVEVETRLSDEGEVILARPARLRLTPEGRKVAGLAGEEKMGNGVSELELKKISPPFGL